MAEKICEFVLWSVLAAFIVALVAAALHAVMKSVAAGRRGADTPKFDPLPLCRFLYDYEICDGLVELKETIQEINKCGYNLVCVSQSGECYAVFFRRFTNENP